MKKGLKSKIVLSVVGVIALIISCTNEFDYGKLQKAVKTISFNNVAQTTAEVSGIVLTDNGSAIDDRGICFGTTNNPTVNEQKKSFNTAALGSYTCVLNNLLPNTIYFARAYATNSFGTAYGATVTFTTLPATVPIISSTTAANLVTATTANTGGTIVNSGASNIVRRGVCYSTTVTTPTISDSRTNDGSGIGIFVTSLTGLTVNTIYYIRAYAINGVGVAYGDVKSFSTTAATIPSGVTTTATSSVTQSTASSGGSISSDGGTTITSRGVCWSSNTVTPTILNSTTSNGSGIGVFFSPISTLLPGTTYYLRAYATNSVGTAYGNLIFFTTIGATIPSVTTTSNVSFITQSSASSGGNVISDGASGITARGVCWSTTNQIPTISNSRTNNGVGIGPFSSSITSLVPGTNYFVRAYATNSIGTAYGSIISFSTIAATIPSGITTTSVSSISQISAISGGSINSDGGSAISAKGVCWSSSTTSPTIFNSRTINGSGTSSFAGALTGLTANTTFYVRAYATNSVGTAYGNMLTFTTLPSLFIGQSYQGGIIAYILVPGDAGYVAGQTNGLICTTFNQSTAAQWGCFGTSIFGTNTSMGSGVANTLAIINGCSSSGTAARICDDLVAGGYADWYLPSRDELNRLYVNRNSIGNFVNTSYWSSSQVNSTASWNINFASGTISGNLSKSSLIYVRAIRKF